MQDVNFPPSLADKEGTMAEQQGSPILEAVPTGAAEGEVITQNGYGWCWVSAAGSSPKPT